MGDVVTYVIIGLFALFFIYFVYTIVDTLVLSKRVRRKVRKLESEPRKDKDDKKSNLEEVSNAKAMASAENSSIAPKKNEKKKFVFPKLSFGSKKKSGKSYTDKDSKFIANRIDNTYFDLIRNFVKKSSGSWTQKELYELILTLVTKGYDKKPSEINKDLQVAKQEMVLQEIENDKNVPHAETLDSIDSTDDIPVKEPSDKVKETEEIKALEEDRKNREEKKRDEEIKEGEKELKKISSEKKETKSTRDELDKTLGEIKALREKLRGM